MAAEDKVYIIHKIINRNHLHADTLGKLQK
jgi:hypothetical protein